MGASSRSNTEGEGTGGGGGGASGGRVCVRQDTAQVEASGPGDDGVEDDSLVTKGLGQCKGETVEAHGTGEQDRAG